MTTAGAPSPDPTLTCTVHVAAPRAALQAVDDGLSASNDAEPSLRDVCPLSVLATDATGRVQGGAVGRSWGTCCELQQLWVHDTQRRQGLGRRLMALFEQAAAERGCLLVYLETFSFQAPGFYERLGYRTVLHTTGYTGAQVKHTMHKSIAPRPPR